MNLALVVGLGGLALWGIGVAIEDGALFQPILDAAGKVTMLIATFIVAPFSAWRERHHRVGKLEEEAEPKLSIFGPYMESIAKGPGTVEETAIIRVTNIGGTTLEQCLLKIERIRQENNLDFRIGARPPIAVRTDGQVRGDRSGRFTLTPRESKELPILIFATSPASPRPPIGLLTEAGTFDLPSNKEHVITVFAHSESLQPVGVKFSVSLVDGHLACVRIGEAGPPIRH